MTEVHIITGFLGAGKTTFINKLLRDGAADGGTVLVENEFGDVSVDSDCIAADIQILEITSGCICCSLQGNFVDGISELCARYSPRQILIEPTGMADLGDTLAAVGRSLERIGGRLGAVITVVNAEAFPALLMMGGDFFRQQIEAAQYIVMSGTQNVGEEELCECRALLQELDPAAPARFEPWEELDALAVLEEAAAVSHSAAETGDAQPQNVRSEVFFPRRSFSEAEIRELFAAIERGDYGTVLRAKGFLRTPEGKMLHSEYVFGGRQNITRSDYEGEAKFVVIGELAESNGLRRLFRFKY